MTPAASISCHKTDEISCCPSSFGWKQSIAKNCGHQIHLAHAGSENNLQIFKLPSPNPQRRDHLIGGFNFSLIGGKKPVATGQRIFWRKNLRWSR